ncbi:Protein phosphatase CheZ [wastewater metagenome]|uniref:Protein phosphatase CheZ n=2 Tax=unclassified sequences TaxID=12908 RepID=A0A5B8R4W4_9ZZZZ|nr:MULTISPECIES: protein phosphatase CheZ [Arhodomonas]MCS4502778.1 protein phosphatase CheZ [Arhodomonas aquaeolei]QEA03739.1 protein phosphatase CheZ [uncultured organism]
MSDSQRSQEYLALARTLIERVEAGDDPGMQETVDELTRLRESELFQEIGQLTRELHEALKSFRVDSRLTDIAASEIPDARERLNHVIEVTSRAAHRTLEAVETSLPLADEVAARAGTLHERWQQFRRRELSADDFRGLSHDIEAFLAAAADNGKTLHNALSEALMAQDYQDITGQIIRRVITLVQEVEDGLVELVRISGARIAEEKPRAADKADERAEQQLSGPAVPGQDDDDVVSGQDDVDDLLSSLGF